MIVLCMFQSWLDKKQYGRVAVTFLVSQPFVQSQQHVGVHTQFSGTKTCIKSINKDAKPSEEKKLSFVQ